MIRPGSARRRGLGQQEAAIRAMPLPHVHHRRDAMTDGCHQQVAGPHSATHASSGEVLPTSLHTTHDKRPPRESSSPPGP